MKLKIADNLSLPLDFVTERIAFLARTGAGKSGGMRVLAEEMHKAKQFFVFLDPKGDSWGIRSDYPVLIMGGEHQNVPLEPRAGTFVADFLIRERISTVLDVSEFSESDMVRFVADFADRFYRKNRETVHWFLDEADEFAPQTGYGVEAAKCLGAIQRIQRRGRGRGIGVTVASQRSAVINKSVLTQSGTMIAMQTTAPHDLDAIDAWLKYAATKEARLVIMAALPTLRPREAFVYSPQLLGPEPRRIEFRAFDSFDSMRTPKHGEARQQPKKLADLDLSAVQKAMAETIERAKADDPRELRKEIARLKAQVKQPEQIVKHETKEVRVEVLILKAALATKLEVAAGRIERAAQSAAAVSKEVSVALANAKHPAPQPKRQVPSVPVLPRTSPAPANLRIHRNGDSQTLPKGPAAILAACIQYPDGLYRRQLTVLTGYKRSTRDAYIQRLGERGFVALNNDRVTTTDEGRAALPDAEPLPTGTALQQFWLARLPEGERALLEQLIAAHPNEVDREQLSESTGYVRSTRDAYLHRMNAKELIVANRGSVKASDDLFD